VLITQTIGNESSVVNGQLLWMHGGRSVVARTRRGKHVRDRADNNQTTTDN
jgi:hypothetical protein